MFFILLNSDRSRNPAKPMDLGDILALLKSDPSGQELFDQLFVGGNSLGSTAQSTANESDEHAPGADSDAGVDDAQPPFDNSELQLDEMISDSQLDDAKPQLDDTEPSADDLELHHDD